MNGLYITKDQISNYRIAILPLGSYEQHGPHMCMAADTILANYISELASKEFDEKILLLPPIFYSCSYEHGDLPYIGVNYKTLINYLKDIVKSLYKFNFKYLIIVNGHGGNYSALDILQRKINFKYKKIKIIIYNIYDNIFDNIKDYHAGSIETSEVFLINKECIDLSKISSTKVRYNDKVFSMFTASEVNKDGVIQEGEYRVVIREDIAKIILERKINGLRNLIRELEKDLV
jgi:creatinine amidohydrolase